MSSSSSCSTTPVVAVKTFRVTFHRPATAIPVSEQQRAQQLREIFAEATRVSKLYIATEVKYCGREENFCITLTANPDYPVAEGVVRQAAGWLNPEEVKKIVSDGTAINPALISVVPKEPAPNQ